MNTPDEMPEIDPKIPEHAVSVYGQSENACDDFPVLKAFQQYIDAEQAKARKRLILICAFFGGLMFIVISVFVGLLVSASSRNQMLNDRLFEYVTRERDQRTGSAVVVQPPQDSSAILALTAKLDEMQKKLAEAQATAEKRAADAATEAKALKASAREDAKSKGPTAEELEIARLKALLSAEREKQAVEREKQRQAELEAYRRKHYPELYEKPRPKVEEPAPRPVQQERSKDKDHEDLLKEVDEILGESEAVTYFDDENDQPEQKAVRQTPSPPAPQKEYSIPVDIQGSSSRWSVPND